MVKVEIGKTAGEAWKFLGKNGKTTASALGQNMSLKPDMLNLVLGWLARENKINFIKEGKGLAITLTDTEAKIYKTAQK